MSNTIPATTRPRRTAKAATIGAAAALVVLVVTGCDPYQQGPGQLRPRGVGVERQAPGAGGEPMAEVTCDANGNIVHYGPHTAAGRAYAERVCGTDHAGMIERGLRQRGITGFGG